MIGARRSGVLFGVGLATAIVFFAFAWIGLVNEPVPWRALLGSVDAVWLAGSLTLLLLAQGLRGMLGWVAGRFTSTPIGAVGSYVAWHSSQLVKYLPGGVWMFPARAGLYMRQGVAGPRAGQLVAQETILLLLTAAVLGGSYVQNVLTTRQIAVVGLVGLAVVLISAFMPLALLPGVGERIGRIREEISGSWVTLGALGAAALATWLLIGAAFAVFLRSFGIEEFSLWESIGIFCAAWAAGFVVVIAPGGLGAREAALVLLFGATLPSGTALAVAILARAWWMAAEGVHFLGAGLVGQSGTRMKRATGSGNGS